MIIFTFSVIFIIAIVLASEVQTRKDFEGRYKSLQESYSTILKEKKILLNFLENIFFNDQLLLQDQSNMVKQLFTKEDLKTYNWVSLTNFTEDEFFMEDSDEPDLNHLPEGVIKESLRRHYGLDDEEIESEIQLTRQLREGRINFFLLSFQKKILDLEQMTISKDNALIRDGRFIKRYTGILKSEYEKYSN